MANEATNSETLRTRAKQPILLWVAYASPAFALLVFFVLIAMLQAPSPRPDRSTLEWIFNGLIGTSVIGCLLGFAGLFGAAANGVWPTVCAVVGIVLNGLVGFASCLIAGLALMSHC